MPESIQSASVQRSLNQPVERIAAGGRFSQLPTSVAAAIAHFFRWGNAVPMRTV